MYTRSSLLLAGLAALCLAAAHPAAAQNLVLQNGALTTNAGGYNGDQTVKFFTGTETYGYAFGAHTQNDSSNTSVSGAYLNGGSIFQLLGSTTSIGETVTLSGQYYFNDATIRSQVELTSATPTLTNATASGSILAFNVLPQNGSNSSFTPLTYTATAVNQSIYAVLVGPDVQPAGSNQYGSQANFDNLSLTDTPPAVPEAASSISLGLMLTLAGLIVAARRKSIRS